MATRATLIPELKACVSGTQKTESDRNAVHKNRLLKLKSYQLFTTNRGLATMQKQTSKNNEVSHRVGSINREVTPLERFHCKMRSSIGRMNENISSVCGGQMFIGCMQRQKWSPLKGERSIFECSSHDRQMIRWLTCVFSVEIILRESLHCNKSIRVWRIVLRREWTYTFLIMNDDQMHQFNGQCCPKSTVHRGFQWNGWK